MNYGGHFPKAILTNFPKKTCFGRPISFSLGTFYKKRNHGYICTSTSYDMTGQRGNLLLPMNYGGHFHKATALGQFFIT